MHADPQPAGLEFAALVHHLYTALIQSAPVGLTVPMEPSLGGKLLYAAELNQQSRALVVAANIAGAASLTASADQAAQKQAVRDGVIDFLVTSLDEALRIFKNEVRKHEPVAVCVARAPESIEREMLNRGVLPDLLPPSDLFGESAAVPFLSQGARHVAAKDTAHEKTALVSWQVSASPARWLPQIDALALECFSADDLATRRWLRLAPRYLGRLAQGMRLARFTQQAAQDFTSRVKAGMRSGEIEVEVKMREHADPLTS